MADKITMTWADVRPGDVITWGRPSYDDSTDVSADMVIAIRNSETPNLLIVTFLCMWRGIGDTTPMIYNLSPDMRDVFGESDRVKFGL